MFMPTPPGIPPIPPDRVWKIAKKVAPLVIDFLGGLIDTLGDKKPVTKNSTAEDINDINKVFQEFRQSIEAQARENERLLLEDVQIFTDDLRWAAQTDNPLFAKYNVRFNRFDRKADSLAALMDGVMMDKISRVISLDSPECSRVIKMLPGTEKDKAVAELFNSACRQGQEAVIAKTNNLCNELLEEYEEAISDAIEQITLSINAKEQELSQLLSCADSDEAEACLAKAESVKQAAVLVQAMLAEEMI